VITTACSVAYCNGACRGFNNEKKNVQESKVGVKTPLSHSDTKLEYMTDRPHVNFPDFSTHKIPYRINMIRHNPWSFTPLGSAYFSRHLVSCKFVRGNIK
jgi:hypothetical protein